MNGGCCGGHGHGDQEAAPGLAAPGREAPAENPPTSLTVTSAAAGKLRELLVKEQKNPAMTGLRLGVQGGGCSGLSYFMDWDEAQPSDRVFEQDGVKVFVDPRSILHLSGSVLDYSEGLMSSGFAIKNPNGKSSCGCGHSFSA